MLKVTSQIPIMVFVGNGNSDYEHLYNNGIELINHTFINSHI